MKKFITTILLLSQFISNSQNNFQSDLCKCIEEKHNSISDIDKLTTECTTIAITKNINEIKEIFKDNLNEESIQKYAWDALSKLSTDCDYYKTNIFPEIMRKYDMKTTLENTACKDYYFGKFYYFDDEKNKIDTVYVDIQKERILINDKKKEFHTEYKLEWIGECEMINYLVETNDNRILSFKEQFEKQQIQIININNEYIELQTLFYEKPYQYKIYKY